MLPGGNGDLIWLWLVETVKIALKSNVGSQIMQMECETFEEEAGTWEWVHYAYGNDYETSADHSLSPPKP